MLISDWSSDVCSSDLQYRRDERAAHRQQEACSGNAAARCPEGDGRSARWVLHRRTGSRTAGGLCRLSRTSLPCLARLDWRRVVWGKSVSVSVDLGGRRILKKKRASKPIKNTTT